MPLPESEPVQPGTMVPRAFEVVIKRQETPDTWTFELEPSSGESLAFDPGQFTMLSAGGAGEVPISISGDPDHCARLVHTVRAVGLATQAICDAEVGHQLWVRGPFGRSWPVEALEGTDVVVAAGGLGLPPLRPALLRLLSRRERYGRLVLLYGARTPDQLVFSEHHAGWTEAGLEMHVTVDAAGPEWLGHVGVVTRLINRAGLSPERCAAIVCGPEVMMRFLIAGLLQQGVPAERVYASMERNMQCGIGHCGHCQLGPTLVCRDGPVYKWPEITNWLTIREL